MSDQRAEAVDGVRGAHSRELPVYTFGCVVRWCTVDEALAAWVDEVRRMGWSPVGEPRLVDWHDEPVSLWGIDLGGPSVLHVTPYLYYGVVQGRCVEHPDLTIPSSADTVLVPIWDTL